MNGLSRAPAERIVREARREPGVRDPGQFITAVPRIGRRPACIGDGRQIAIEIGGQRIRPERALLIVGVVTRGRQSQRDGRAREGPAGFDPIASQIVRVDQISDDRRSLLERQARELGRHVVGIGDTVPIGIADTGPQDALS